MRTKKSPSRAEVEVRMYSLAKPQTENVHIIAGLIVAFTEKFSQG